MRFDLKEITRAVSKVGDINIEETNIPGMLLIPNKEEGTMRIGFFNSRKALTDKINVEFDEGDPSDKFKVEYNEFMEALNCFQPSGIIKVETVEARFEDGENGSKTMVMSVNGFADVMISETETQRKKCSTKTKAVMIKMIPAGAEVTDAKCKLLTRFDYDSIFQMEDMDTWEREEIVSLFSSVSIDKNKTLYVAPKSKSVFVCNKSSIVEAPFDKDITSPLSLGSSDVKAILNILGKSESETVFMRNKDNRYCYICDDEGKTGIWLEMKPVNTVDVNALGTYKSKRYCTYQLTFYRDFISDMIKTAVNNNMDKVNLTFKAGDEGITMRIENAIFSKSKDKYELATDSYYDGKGDIESAKISVSLKILQQIITSFKEDNIMIDIDIDENNVRAMRIAEPDYEKMSEVLSERKMELGMDITEPLSSKEIAELRGKFLGTRSYSMLG